MPSTKPLAALDARIVRCRRCPRLIEHCRHVAMTKRASYRDFSYWGKPVLNFGDPQARILVVGLAPGAHGANRTGRMFTGDRSGDFLYRAMHAAGLANQPHATDREDGLTLKDTLITAVCHCAPPDNKPSNEEMVNCAPWLEATFDALADLRVVMCLGRIALAGVLRLYKKRGCVNSMASCTFGHGAEYTIPGAPTIVCSYHPSQQNTFTGRLTDAMLLQVFRRAIAIAQRAAE